MCIRDSPVDDELQVVPVQLVLAEYVPEHLQGRLCRPVHLDDGVALVGEQVYLVVQAVYLLLRCV